MIKTLVVILMATLLTSVLFVGCGVVVTGSGNLETETFDFSNFTKVEAHNGFQVELTQSSAYSIEITTDDNVQEYLEVTESGDTLKIRLTGFRTYSSVTLEAKITMPDIYGINLSGGSQADITGFSSSHDFSAALSGGSGLDGNITTADADFDLSGGSRVAGSITAGDADFGLSGGSQVNLDGTADDVEINSSGGSQLDLEAFPVSNADVNISGGGRATVNVSGTLDVNLSGGSRVLYVGEPTLGDIDLSGDSTISKK